MKVSVPAVAPPTPPDTGASSIIRPFFSASRGDRARGFHIDGRAVDQQRAGIGVLDDAVRRRDRPRAPAAGRQHGDDDVGARGGDFGELRAGAARRFQFGDRGRIDVDALDLVAGLDQVLRHRQTHIAEPDKSDARHGALPVSLYLRRAVPAPISTPAKDRARAARLPARRSPSCAPNTCGKKISTASMEATAVSQITAPQAAASHRPTAATRSITAKNTVAACQAME